MRIPRKHQIGIGLGLGTLLLRFLLGFSPTLTETIYSRGLFVGIRWLFDLTITNMPFPLVYLVFLLLIFFTVKKIRSRSPNAQKLPFAKRLTNLFISLLSFAGIVIFLFMFLWGFNYGRQPIQTQLNLNIQPLDSVALHQESLDFIQRCNEKRLEITAIQDTVFNTTLVPTPLEKTMRTHLKKTLKDLGYPSPGKVRGRVLKPKGILMRFSTSGIYVPFWGEGHIDGGLHALSKIYTIAHEMAHGYGLTNEGTCNFLAYLSCLASDDPAVQYAGLVMHSRYVLSAYKQVAPWGYQHIKKEMSAGYLADIAAIKKNNAKYPDLLPMHKINNLYLKAQGIKEGLKSYSRVVLLVHAYEKQSKN